MGRPGDGPEAHPDKTFPARTPGRDTPRYLFTVDGEHPESTLPIVCDLVADAGAELVVGSPVVLPDQTSLEAPEPRRDGRRRAAKFVLKAKQRCDVGSRIEQAVVAGHSRRDIIQTMVDRYDVSTVVTEDRPRGGVRSLLGLGGVDEAAVTEGVDTIIVARIGYPRAVESVLVPIARGPHSGLAIETGLALARRNEASLELLHVRTAGEDGREEGEEVLDVGIERLDGYERAERTLLEASEVPEAIIQRSRPFDVTVFGAPREGRLRQFMLGSVPEDVSAETDGAVLIAHRGGTADSWLDKWI